MDTSTKKILYTAAGGGLGGASVGALAGLLRGRALKDVLAETAIGGLSGAGAGATLGLAHKYLLPTGEGLYTEKTAAEGQPAAGDFDLMQFLSSPMGRAIVGSLLGGGLGYGAGGGAGAGLGAALGGGLGYAVDWGSLLSKLFQPQQQQPTAAPAPAGRVDPAKPAVVPGVGMSYGDMATNAAVGAGTAYAGSKVPQYAQRGINRMFGKAQTPGIIPAAPNSPLYRPSRPGVLGGGKARTIAALLAGGAGLYTMGQRPQSVNMNAPVVQPPATQGAF